MSNDTPIKIGIIGGSGLGDALCREAGTPIELDTPFGEPSSPITCANWDGTEIAILQRHGQGHIYNPTVVPYRANIFALKHIGVTHIIASGATGSLREHIHPGDIVIADQVIDKTTKRVHTFYERAAVHVEMADPFCPVMRHWLLDAKDRAAKDKQASKLDAVNVHAKGTYICMEGPAFSTKAESHMHRACGGDLIGMTTMPEAKLAREAEIAYALIALPTDYDCWKDHEPGKDKQSLLTEIIGNLETATNAGIELIKAALSDITVLEETKSPAHDALALGIWSNKSKIPKDEVEKLHTLWGRYFEG